jgi:hypothetical protein
METPAGGLAPVDIHAPAIIASRSVVHAEGCGKTAEFDGRFQQRYPAVISLVLFEHPLRIARCGAHSRLTT